MQPRFRALRKTRGRVAECDWDIPKASSVRLRRQTSVRWTRVPSMLTAEFERARPSETTLGIWRNSRAIGRMLTPDRSRAPSRSLSARDRAMLGPKTNMSNFRKQSAAALRFAERRQREDEAPRLSA